MAMKLIAATKNYLWGGQKLKEKYGKRTDEEKVAESWELSFLDAGLTKLVNGATLKESVSAQEFGVNTAQFPFFPTLVKFIDAKDTFSLTFLEGQQAALKYLGTVSGRDEDKIANARLNVNYSEDTPFIDDGNLVFICKKLSATRMTADQFIDSKLADTFYKDGDMHTMYVGEITQILAR